MSKDIDSKARETKGHLPLPGSSIITWLSLVLGILFLAFSYGVDDVPIAAWLAPALLLRFARAQRWVLWLPLLFIGEATSIAFQMRGMTVASGIGNWITLAVGGAAAIVPFVVDKAVANRVGWLGRIVAFPLAWTVMDYVNSFGPFGSWGATAYSQYGQLSLLQMLSITGLWGITFLIGWFATSCNLLIEEGVSSRRARAVAYVFGIAMVTILFSGALRLSAFPPETQVVRVASVAARDLPGEPKGLALQRIASGNATAADLTEFRSWANLVDSDLLVRTDEAAKGGAKIAFWGEGNAPVLEADEPTLIGEGGQLARKDHIYLGMTMLVWRPGRRHPAANKQVMMQPNGEVAWEYEKTHPVPGVEARILVPGDGKLRVVSTPYGKLSTAICFDADFPRTVAQAGTMGADILLNPSNDWRGIDPWHTEMASFRAIEQGFNIIHLASHGRSAAYDYEGNRLATLDYFQTQDPTMIAYVPTRGIRTVYSRFGDWFAWLSIVGLLAVVASALRSKRSSS